MDVVALVEDGRELFEREEHMSAAGLRDALAGRHPEADVRAIAAVVRTSLPLVRVPDGGRWGFTPKAPFTDAERWLGRSLRKRPDRAELVRRYLAALGPASVRDAETWLGGGGLGPVFEKLRPELLVLADESGASCSTCRMRRARPPTRWPLSGSCPSSTTSCSRMPIARA